VIAPIVADVREDLADRPPYPVLLQRGADAAVAQVVAAAQDVGQVDRPVVLAPGQPPALRVQLAVSSMSCDITGRRVWDSNPRGHSRALAVFKTAAIGH
jgi:hypothetical protein